MNDRYEQLKPLAEKAWFVFHNERDYAHENAMLLGQLERFATLVEAAAVAKEREAIAKSLEVTYAKGDGTALLFDILAKDIRARGNYEQD